MKLSKTKIISLSIFTAFILQMNLVAEDVKKSESLGSIDVVSTDSNITEGTGSYTTAAMGTSTKLDLSIRETPQSVSVFTSQKLQDLGIKTYADMLGYVTGVTVSRWDERLNSSARGFVIDYYKVDGMPTYTSYNDRDIDLSIYDRVEVVRGANGLTTGAGNPGISINLVKKRATSKEFTGKVTAEVGSWNSYSTSADISSALNKKGSIRGRVIVKHETADSYMDGYKKENDLLYAVVDTDLSDTTRLSTGFSYTKSDKSGVRWGGLPAFDNNGARINFDSSKTVSEDWTYWNTETKSFFTNLEQILYEDVSLNLAYSFDQTTKDTALLYFKGALNTSDGSGLSSMDWQAEEKQKEHNLDINVNIPFEIKNLSQEVVIGTSYNLTKKTKYEGRYPNGYYDTVPNFYDYNISLPATSNSDILYVVKPEQIKQTAVYLAAKLSLSENLKLIAGTRLSSWEYSSDDITKDKRKFENEITPYIGLVYDIDENHSIYTSYTSIFNPQDDKDINGDYLDPIDGKSYETGIKGEYFDGALNTSISLFRIEQDGVATDNPNGTFIPGTTTIASIASEGVTSKGFEIDIAGKVTDKLSLDFGIANFKAEDAQGNKFNTKASRTTSNLFAKYLINDFTIGGGLQYKSKYYTGDGATQITQDAYTIANAMISYKANKNTNVQLNVNNISDKEYYQGIGKNGMVYGDPRNFTITAKYTF